MPATAPAYVYVKPEGGWVNAEETAQLSAADGPNLGYGVAISGNNIFAGSANANVSGTFQAGAVFLYNKPTAGAGVRGIGSSGRWRHYRRRCSGRDVGLEH
jgi:hypothetical protein